MPPGAESTSSIYSASGRYTDSVKALEVNGDIAAMHPGTASPVGFSILNDGVNPITSVTVDLGGKSEYGRVIYTSSDPSVAEVDENGIVTAKYKGTCVITAEIKGTGIKEECTVTVGMTLCQLIGNFIARIINNVLIPAAEKTGCACAVRTLRKIADFID